MRPLNLFLARFAQLAPSDTALKLAVQRAVEDELAISFDPKLITVNRQNVYLAVSPALRNLLFMKREQIVAAVRAQLGEKRERNLL